MGRLTDGIGRGGSRIRSAGDGPRLTLVAAMAALLIAGVLSPMAAAADPPVVVTVATHSSYSPVRSFSPNGDDQEDDQRVYYCITRNSNVTITVKDSGGVVVRTIESAKSHSGSGSCSYSSSQNNNFIWDGEDDAGQVVADGDYTYTISAIDPDNGTGSVTHVTYVDTRAPGMVTDPVAGAELSGTAGFVFTPTTSEPAMTIQSVSVDCLGSASSAEPDGTWRGSADTTLCAGGATDINATVQWRDKFNQLHTFEGPAIAVTIANPPKVTVATHSAYSPVESFSPNGDGQEDDQRVYYCITRDSNVTITVKNSSGTVVRTIESDVARTGNSTCSYSTSQNNNFIWDGEDDAGQVVADGDYTYTISAIDPDNGTGSVTHVTYVDTRAPGMVTDPVAGAELSGTAGFVFTPTTSEPAMTIQSVSVDCLGSASSAEPDGTWRGSADTTLCAGGATDINATVQWRDKFNQLHTFEGPAIAVTIANPPKVTVATHSAYSPVRSFSPNGDGQEDDQRVYYCITRNSNVTITVKNSSGTVVRTIGPFARTGNSTCSYSTSQNNNFIWDGEDDAGQVVADGDYSYTISAMDAFGTGSVTHVTYVDTRAPGMVTDPVAGAELSGTAGFVFTPTTSEPAMTIQSVSVDCLGSASSAEPDGTWRGSADTTLCAGGATDINATVQWRDKFNQLHTFEGPAIAVTIANPLKVTVATHSAYSPVRSFSPNGDGQEDDQRVYYCITRDSNVTITVKNSSGTVVRTIGPFARTGNSTCSYSTSQNNNFIWDGEDDAGQVVADGDYSYTIAATDGPDSTEVDHATFVDSRVPGTLTEPASGDTVAGLATFVLTPTAGVDITEARVCLSNGGGCFYMYNASPDGKWRTSTFTGQLTQGLATLSWRVEYVDPLGDTKYWNGPSFPVTIDTTAIPLEISVSPNEGVRPLATEFTIEASEPNSQPLNYSVTFGDGQTASGTISAPYEPIKVQHTYLDSDVYNATVSVDNSPGIGLTVKTITITVEDPPKLTVLKAGTGAGTVSSDPSGIDCGETCSSEFAVDADVELTAVADTGSEFSGWSGDTGGACEGSGSCTVTMDQARTVTATFTRVSYGLTVSKAGSGSGTVSSDPAGVNCGVLCAFSFAVGADVELTAVADAGSEFSGWSGDTDGACEGSGSCTVTMGQARTVTATFTRVSYGLTVSKAGSGAGTVSSDPVGVDCGATCSFGFAVDAVVELTAVADAGSEFSGWSGDTDGACEGSGPCTVTMGQARTVIATFTLLTTNHPPYAVDDAAVAHGVGPLQIKVLKNDTDVDGDELEIVAFDDLGGRVTCGGDSCTYTAPTGYAGTETFRYTASDGMGGLSKARVTVRVRGNKSPLVSDDEMLVHGTGLGGVDVLFNDVDPDGDTLTISVENQPASGTASCAVWQCTYRSTSGDAGTDSFSYRVDDGQGGTATALVLVTIEENGAPTAVDDEEISHGPNEFHIGVLANDVDPEDDGLTIVENSPAGSGTVSCSTSSCAYTPPTGQPFPIQDSFTYTVNDGHGVDNSTATVTVRVNENQAPRARDDLLTAPGWDSPATTPSWGRIQPLSNDLDPDGDRIGIVDVTQPASGNGQSNCYYDGVTWWCEYAPAAGNTQPDSFTYTMADENGAQATATISVSVAPNAPPDALPDVLMAHGSAEQPLDLLSNDTDPDGDKLSVIANTAIPVEQGSVQCTLDGCTYQPPAGYDGPYPLTTDPFSYTMSDGRGGRDTAEATINLIRNQPPIALDDRATARFGAPSRTAVIGNDIDPDGDELSITEFSQPAHGVASCDTTGTVNKCSYTPLPGYLGRDSFTYTVTDGHGEETSTATVNVTVIRNSAPTAGDDLVNLNDGRLTTIELPNDNDIDPDDDPIRLLEYTEPTHGTLTCGDDRDCTYFPDPGALSDDSFTYVVTDDLGGVSAPATVTIQVTPNRSPTAADDTMTVVERRTSLKDVVANDVDLDGDQIRVTSWTDAEHGTVQCTKALRTACTYTLDPDYAGAFPLNDSFTYTVTDGRPGSTPSTATVSVNVIENREPIAQDDSASTSGKEPISIDVLHNDVDPDGDPYTIVGLEPDPGMQGTVTCAPTNCRYAPPEVPVDGTYPFTDTFTYTISDPRGHSASAEVTVTVTAPIGAPNAVDDHGDVRAGRKLTINVRSNDTGFPGDIIDFTQPANGSSSCPDLNGGPGTCSYTPNSSFVGSDAFTYTIEDIYGRTSTAEVTVEVAEIDPFVAVDDEVTVSRTKPAQIDVLDNDENPGDDPIRIVDFNPQFPVLTSGQGARVSCSSSTCWYVPPVVPTGPEPTYPLTDTFTYEATDGLGNPVGATVTVHVIDNRAPTAVNDNVTVRGPDMINVLKNDSDADHDEFGDIEWDTTGTTGVVTGCSVATGYCEYEPSSTGADTFKYRVSDDPYGAWSNWATVTVDVVGNHDPIAKPDAELVEDTNPLFINVRSNDRDPDGDAISVVPESKSTDHGTVTCVAEGCTYQASAPFAGFDTFEYTINDGQGGTATAMVTITFGTPPGVPSVTGLDPVSGSTAGGTSVVITGTDFTGATGVVFGSVPATDVTVDSATQITVVSPAGDAGEVDVRVTTPAGTSAVVAEGVFTYVEPEPEVPSVTGLDPVSGSTAGGTSVVITGTDFTGATGVVFGSVPATDVTVDSATQITVVSPAGDAGEVDVRVTTPAGTSAVVAEGVFTYVEPEPDVPSVTGLDPVSGSTAGGTSVVITGTDFTGATGVVFGSVPATDVTVDSATQITVVSPAGDAGEVDVRVTTPAGTSAVVAEGVFTYVEPEPEVPSVTGLDPTSGSTAGGTSVVITGTDFAGATGVVFGSVPATDVTVDSATQITVVSPAGDAGEVDVRVTTPAGTSAVVAEGVFTYVEPEPEVPSVTGLDPTSGSTAGGTSVVITGTDFAGATGVVFGSVPATDVTVDSATQITVVSPAGDAGEVDVRVTTPAGTSAVVPEGVFTYVHGGSGPVAVDDTASTLEDSATGPLDVLANDAGDALEVVPADISTANGSVQCTLSECTYTPNANFHGEDQFDYVVTDAHGGTDTGTVTVTVQSVNDPPVAESRGVSGASQTIVVQATDVDSTSLSFSVVQGTVGGTLGSFSAPTCTTAASGTTTCTAMIAYTRNADYYGADLFTFQASDGSPQLSNVATVNIATTCTQTAAATGSTLTGTAGADILCGGPGNDTINGLGGNDILLGNGGNDVLNGGAGNDSILGGPGIDTIVFPGQPGPVTVDLRRGTAAGEGFDHTLDGIENVTGTPANDTLIGNNDPNRLTGLGGDDTINGIGGDDVLIGNGGNDKMLGGNGNDTVFGNEGHDELFGQDGNDELYGLEGNDRVSGGNGNDIVSGGTATGSPTSGGNDSLFGGKGNDSLFGGNGSDSLFGQDGNDALDGGSGQDTINGGAGRDTISGGAGGDAINGNDGKDTINGGAGRDTISGGAGGDTINGDDGGDTINGNDGNDTINGGAGRDTINGGAGRDRITGGAGADEISGGADKDTINGNDGNDTINGNGGNDVLSGDAGVDIVSGNGGNDKIHGGSAPGRKKNTLYGGAGRDCASAGPDRIPNNDIERIPCPN